MRKSSDSGNKETKKLNRVGDIQYTCALRTPTLVRIEGESVKLYQQLAVHPFKLADSHRSVLLLREERVSVRMSIVCLIISKALVKSIVLVNVRNVGRVD